MFLLVPAHAGRPGQRAVKCVVCVLNVSGTAEARVVKFCVAVGYIKF